MEKKFLVLVANNLRKILMAGKKYLVTYFDKVRKIPKMEHVRLMSLIDKVQEFLLWGLIFCLPFSKSLIEILFTCMLILWVTKRVLIYRHDERVSVMAMFKPVSTKLNFPILVFFIVNFVSMVTSVSIFLSLEGFFLKLFEYVAMYFILVEIACNAKKIDKILIAVVASVALITVNGLFQYFGGTGFIRGYSFSGCGWIQSSFGNQNDFAAWLIMVLPPVLGLAYFWVDAWREHFGKFGQALRSVRMMFWVLTVFLITCLIFAGSRGAWLSAIFSLIFLGIVMKNIRLILMIPLVLFICTLIVPQPVKERAKTMLSSIPFSSSFLSLSSSISARSASVFSVPAPDASAPAPAPAPDASAPAHSAPAQGDSISIRLKLWREAIDIIEDFPITGTGPNTYSIVAPSYKNYSTTGFYPHNSYLHMAAEIGLLGFGTFLLVVLSLFVVTLKKIKNTKDKFQRTLLAGFLAGFFGFLGHSVVDTNLFSIQLSMLMWMIMGIIMAVNQLASLSVSRFAD
ncbi:MAG: O-antigen ligase family protein [Candidatus Omnitrophota bacterium]